ncbi:hypothetical protein O6H91_06G085400 [Diphasiastrum complanatum]|uniref:Uncharacterized protein n=5 Tax=Diphasiastrum complanatum TaxID=34168 RepID=A0ACC2DFU9_DIPCM|nr:hypothetical protein O6H91_06G085400 [Diphasiastrum complanatum]KAJ7553148.1 hypothetical protein O6H91_06G085400 [Diphasiastrum complanatum]KAJ7553149.1 hypothetical protein O6H91_06G085400 [Diphasiastrum complanatum]KAJ7553150.1 hypothetical protein O6H91_06G085400 [Diphasiastrum complanatum]KAJ7553151.1 hypothetical protein O6H91_06G085400 [Diphasiastrum complanatum]
MPLNLDFTKDLTFEEESPELELIDRNGKFAEYSDAALDEKLETFKGHLKTLNLKDTRKLENHIKAIELEKQKRLKSRELAKEKACSQNSNGGIKHSQMDMMDIDHSTKLLVKSNPSPNFTTLSENFGPTSKIGYTKTKVDAQGISASRFYEEMSTFNSGRKRQPFYNLRKPSIGCASGIETLKVYKRSVAKGQAALTHSEPVEIDDDTATISKELKEMESLMLKTHGVAAEKKTSKKRCNGLERRGGTLDSALILFSSDEEDCPENDRITPISENLQHLHSRHLQRRNTEQQRCDGVKIAYPSREDPDAVEVLFSDLQQLKSMDFLNDVIIDFYIKYIQETRCPNPELKKKFHFFNTFFFKKLTEALDLQRKKKTTDGFIKLRKWIKGLDIFERSFLFVPVHDNLHWSLAIICLQVGDIKESPQICILHLDSMENGHNTEALFKILKSYLEVEWNYRIGSAKDLQRCKLLPENVQGKKVRVPMQQNVFDCGLFLLHYIELFVENPPSPFGYENIDNMFGQDWFIPDEASSLRKTIRKLIESLFANEPKERKESSSGHSTQSDFEPIIME